MVNCQKFTTPPHQWLRPTIISNRNQFSGISNTKANSKLKNKGINKYVQNLPFRDPWLDLPTSILFALKEDVVEGSSFEITESLTDNCM